MNYIKPAAMIPVDTTVSESSSGVNAPSGCFGETCAHEGCISSVNLKYWASEFHQAVERLRPNGLNNDACLWGEAPLRVGNAGVSASPRKSVPSPSPADRAVALALAAQAARSRRVELGPDPALSQSFSRFTDPFCRLPLPTLFHRPEAVHLGDLIGYDATGVAALSVLSFQGAGNGHHSGVGALPAAGPYLRLSVSGWAGC
ncbi:hypothetical protein Bca52824_095020 [Brassica carinata]|uniref:Uncharacterized protein n=1 Tax=Brassica carinata TaxID=52824 RepID=A0A8X7TIK9_BRACI|nr:hypothetical protein Bca52824_095020 [Brassica carinata]